jgi:hypothetical protein
LKKEKKERESQIYPFARFLRGCDECEDDDLDLGGFDDLLDDDDDADREEYFLDNADDDDSEVLSLCRFLLFFPLL